MTQTDVEIYHVLRFEEYCENDYTIQSNLQIKCNQYQIPSGIFQRIRTKKF